MESWTDSEYDPQDLEHLWPPCDDHMEVRHEHGRDHHSFELDRMLVEQPG